MKVLAINGSPRANGNTAQALTYLAEELRAQGVEVEIVQVGNQPVRSCIACEQCHKRDDHHCVFDDVVNACIDKAAACDGFIFGSPTYYGGMSGALKCFMDRLFYTGAVPKYKVGLAVAVARRTGGLDAWHQINNYMDLANCIRVPMPYWGVEYGGDEGEIRQDAEGVCVLRTAARQMAWLMKSLAAAKDTVPMPELPAREWTNFIR